MVKEEGRKNYKEILARMLMKKREFRNSQVFHFTKENKIGKRGQVAIFVIVGLVIIAAGVLVYFFVPEVRNVISGEISPNSFVSSCLEEEINNGIELLSKQGGYANPEGYIMHQGNKIKYLCYTAQYHQLCMVQQPRLVSHFEQELSEIVKRKAEECASELRRSYQSRGYSVSGESNVDVNTSIVQDKIVINVNAPMVASKGELTQSFTAFSIERRSKIYSLLMTAVSIIDFESTYGDSETLTYVNYYPNLIMYKFKLGDGTTVYTVGDATTGEEFTFASRSLAWPGGYGTEA